MEVTVNLPPMSNSIVTVAEDSKAILREDINLGPAAGSNLRGLAAVSNRLYFVADVGMSLELWVSDGTPEGTSLNPGTAGSHPRWIIAAGDRLFYLDGGELWISDGTLNGRERLQGLGVLVDNRCCSSLFLPPPNCYFQRTDTLFFAADHALHGFELCLLPLGETIAPRFHRGDPNSSGTTDISDAIIIFGYLFLGDPATLTCTESADANNDGAVDISDGIYLLSWLFTGGPEPAAPGLTGAPCGFDPDPPGSQGDLGCEAYAPCQ